MHKTEKMKITEHLFSICDIDKITLKKSIVIENKKRKRQIRTFFSE